MKVLIISHNVLGGQTNMGKTLQAWFQDFAPEDVAQFYIRGEEPEKETVCRNHFCFTDVDALRSLIGLGQAGLPQNPAAKAAYRYGRKRTALGYLLRTLLWKQTRWKTPEFWQWVEAFEPDVVFLASGDHGFLYNVALEIAESVGKPLTVACVDDYYLYDRWEGSLLGLLARRSFLRSVHRAMNRADRIFPICPAMAREYETLFRKPCRVLYTPTEPGIEPTETCSGDIVYLGNVSLKRNEQLARIGRALQRLDIPGVLKILHVYSGEQNPQMLQGLTPENGICFHGAVDGKRAGEILRTSMAAVHVESFDPALRSRLRFSVSTKIPQILAQGPCLIAFGPEGIASMDYLKENGAAYTITDPADLEEGLRRILSDAALRRKIQDRARALARRNHGPGALRQYLAEMCGE